MNELLFTPNLSLKILVPALLYSRLLAVIAVGQQVRQKVSTFVSEPRHAASKLALIHDVLYQRE